MDYVNFFGLREAPFNLLPNSRFFFGGSSHKKAFSYLAFGLNKGEGFIVITGEIGAGKTTIIDLALRRLPQQSVMAAKVAATQFEADDFLRVIAHAFGLDAEGRDKASVYHALEVFLIGVRRDGRRPILFVDEAQGLVRSALEELRMLSNLQQGDQSLLQIILIGQPELRNLLARPDLDQLRQRVIATYHLKALEQGEVGRYVLHRLNVADWKGVPVFSDDCFPLIYKQTGGVPRKINNLCDRVLWFAFLEERDVISQDDVSSVIEEMKAEDFGNFSGESDVVTEEKVFSAENLMGSKRGASERDSNIVGITRTVNEE